MSQIIENLNFFIMEKFYLVELFAFTKFHHHLVNILMNRHISLKYLYSISLTQAHRLQQKICQRRRRPGQEEVAELQRRLIS